jgi:hypothetical protein
MRVLPEASSQPSHEDQRRGRDFLQHLSALPFTVAWLSTAHSAESSAGPKINMVYEVGELFELGILLSYLFIVKQVVTNQILLYLNIEEI